MLAVAPTSRRHLSPTPPVRPPRWVTLRRHPQTCTHCRRIIPIGSPAFLIPRLQSFYCGRKGCGPIMSRRWLPA